VERLRADGLIGSPDVRFVPLSGGVSCDVYRVEQGGRCPFVVKRALAKLRVAADWRADTSRNRYERLYMEEVGRILPGSVPAVIASGDGYFAMEWLGEEWENWKLRLLAGDCREEDARLAGATLGRIHRGTADSPAMFERFDTTGNFRQLRLDPYLLTAAEAHPGLRELIEAEVDRIASTRECLVHGDYSPKNLLLSGGRLVVLDCEVAWFGEPAFDLAFLLNHLLLKALHHHPADPGMAALFSAAAGAYLDGFSRERAGALEARVARLLPMLLLARVDGKSPAEYLTPEKREIARRFAAGRIARPECSLEGLREAWVRRLARPA
jgi:aminoglycoside phosphotransferase (APT) family kinase protein